MVLTAAALLPSALGGTLSATFAPVSQGSTVDLSSEGKVDWIHWGLHTESSQNRKSGMVPQISDYRLVDTTNGFAFAYQYADNYNGYSWADGYPAVTVTNTPTGVWAYGTPALESGFEISAPADTITRILKVYVGVFAGTGRLRAFLSDGSAPSYTNCAGAATGPGCDPLENFRNGPGRVYTLQYSANSANQKLVVRWTLAALRDPTANVTLQAAALSAEGANNPPVVTLAVPTNNAPFAAGTDITCEAAAYDLDGEVRAVEFWNGTNKLGQAETSPYRFVWSGAPVGHHRLTARAIDPGGAARISMPVDIFVSGAGGVLSGSMTWPAGLVDLTAIGTADWAHWGLVPPPGYDRKAAVVPQVANFRLLGTNVPVPYSNDLYFAWSDGTPHETHNGTGSGIYMTGYTNGFEFTLPANTTPRQVKVYTGLYGAHGNFQAFLSDGSAPAYTDTSVDLVYDTAQSVYTLDYAAASPGQKLVIRFRSMNIYDADYGNVALQSIALQGPVRTLPRIFNASRQNGIFRLSVGTDTNSLYRAEFSEVLSPSDWIVFTNFTGTGSTFTVTDDSASGPQRFYRVTAE